MIILSRVVAETWEKKDAIPGCMDSKTTLREVDHYNSEQDWTLLRNHSSLWASCLGASNRNSWEPNLTDLLPHTQFWELWATQVLLSRHGPGVAQFSIVPLNQSIWQKIVALNIFESAYTAKIFYGTTSLLQHKSCTLGFNLQMVVYSGLS